MSMDYYFMSQEDENASANPKMVMVDNRTGEKYARAVGHKGIAKDQDMEWLIKDMSNELKVWGTLVNSGKHHPEVGPALLAVRDALAKNHGGIVVQEASCW